MLEDGLRKSIEQYRQLLSHAQQLEQVLAQGDVQRIQAHVVRLHELQAGAAHDDSALLAGIESDPSFWETHPLFLERRQLQEQILEMNHLILPRIRGMMSVTAAELAQLKNGRTVVSGYYRENDRSRKSTRGVG